MRKLIKKRLVIKFNILSRATLNDIKECRIVQMYSSKFNMQVPYFKHNNYFRKFFKMQDTSASNTALLKKKRGYAKRMTRLRYRWYYKKNFAQFKLFKKNFRRIIKRYRKIQKNRLFITKFKKNFSKLTGFNQKFIYNKWLKFHQNYNQYWLNSNAVLKFSQSLLLSPYAFLVALKIAPSLLASRYLINVGAISINGKTVTIFDTFLPGDILQINLTSIASISKLFSYQKWQNFAHTKQNFPFLYTDWSSMLFYIVKWPKSYELVAPSFLSERWIRYYIRLFPVKAVKFTSIKHNTKIYKKIISKKID